MPLIVEDGTGITNADALASVDFVDNYHNSRGNGAWQVIGLTRKEQLIRRATDYVKYIFGRSFAGTIVVAGQSQPFPRIINYINVGNPIAIQECIAELALIADITPLMPNQLSMRKRVVKVGSLQVEYDANAFTGPKFKSAVARLEGFLIGTTNGITAKLVRT